MSSKSCLSYSPHPNGGILDFPLREGEDGLEDIQQKDRERISLAYDPEHPAEGHHGLLGSHGKIFLAVFSSMVVDIGNSARSPVRWPKRRVHAVEIPGFGPTSRPSSTIYLKKMGTIAMTPSGASKCPDFIATTDANAVTADGSRTSSTPITAGISVAEPKAMHARKRKLTLQSSWDLHLTVRPWPRLRPQLRPGLMARMEMLKVSKSGTLIYLR
jgi:hypothetical protein